MANMPLNDLFFHKVDCLLVLSFTFQFISLFHQQLLVSRISVYLKAHLFDFSLRIYRFLLTKYHFYELFDQIKISFTFFDLSYKLLHIKIILKDQNFVFSKFYSSHSFQDLKKAHLVIWHCFSYILQKQSYFDLFKNVR